MTRCHKGVRNWGCIISSLSSESVIHVDVIYDSEAQVFVAESPDLQGLVVEAKTLSQLKVELQYCIAELLCSQLQMPFPPERT